MKKLLVVLSIGVSAILFSQEDKQVRFGLQWGIHGNGSRLSGGMEQANARFNDDKAGGGALAVVIRYDHNQHWMLTHALGFQSFGFQYSLSQNYSLLKPETKFAGVKSEFVALELPLMIHYKFNPSCNNRKWVIGLGLVNGMVASQTQSKTFIEGTEAGNGANKISATTQVYGGHYSMLRFAVGREKVYKRGSIFNASLILNLGLRNLATARVNYTVEGQSYNHEFTNNGNYIGLRLTYFLRPEILK